MFTISTLNNAIHAAWLAGGAVWVITAIGGKRAVRTEPYRSRIGHTLTFAVAFGLIFSAAFRQGPLGWPLLPSGATISAAGLALTSTGIAIAVWARFCLGGNWSSIVAVKQGHTLVRTGPYAVVRHPIYSGLLLAMLGTALVCGELGAFLGVVLAFAGWLAKARMEESFLLAHFGEGYLEYRRRVRTLIPFVL